MWNWIAGAAAGLVLMSATAATAATVTNEDKVAHLVIIEEAGSKRELTLQPAESIKDACQSTCGIWLGDSENGYDLFKADKVTISNGEVFFEEVEAAKAKPQQ